MTPELEALARRAVACPRWRWMPGMKVGNDRIMDESETREVRSDELPDRPTSRLWAVWWRWSGKRGLI